MKIVFLPETLDYFNELSTILYEKGYFGFEENALKYVDELLLDIRSTLYSRAKRTAPPYFDKYGKNMLYSSFKKNKTTEWFVFFNIYEEENEITLVIRFISNNHVIAQYL